MQLYTNLAEHQPQALQPLANALMALGYGIDQPAQAMGMADIGAPEWVEKGFDYENQQGISTGKILGFLKPKFTSQYTNGTLEDFGVIAVDVAQ